MVLYQGQSQSLIIVIVQALLRIGNHHFDFCLHTNVVRAMNDIQFIDWRNQSKLTCWSIRFSISAFIWIWILHSNFLYYAMTAFFNWFDLTVLIYLTDCQILIKEQYDFTVFQVVFRMKPLWLIHAVWYMWK